MKIESSEQLEELHSIPNQRLIDMMERLDGDIMILGVAGKMGITLARMAVRAVEKSKAGKTVYGVARFSEESARAKLEAVGVKTITCDLLDQKEVDKLPLVPNIIYMAGRKFGTDGSEDLTWAMNTTVPAYVADHFRESRIVAFSTGCVYPLIPLSQIGCDETDSVNPVGEYAQSCLGRERTFQYFSKKNSTPVLLLRLNYAIDLRYGVLCDIAQQIWNGLPVNNSVGYFNAIWQGDANNVALLALEHCDSPATILNISGPETVSIVKAAEHMGKIMGKPVTYTHSSSGEICYLNDSGKAFSLFGYPSISMNQMIQYQAEWIMNGGETLGKPTHFEVNTGKF